MAISISMTMMMMAFPPPPPPPPPPPAAAVSFSSSSSSTSSSNYRRRTTSTSLNSQRSPPLPHPYELNSPSELQQLHAHLIKIGAPLSLLPLSRVASLCALTHFFPYAQLIFLRFPTKKNPIFFWNSCLSHFSPSQAILLFSQLLTHNVCPDAFTCSFLLNACLNLRHLSLAIIIHALILKLGLHSNLVLHNALLQLYASCAHFDDALLLFDKMPHRDVVTWNTMITQLVKRGSVNSAYNMFVEMPERNLRSWTAMIAGFVQCGKSSLALDLFTKMEQVGLKPNEVTVVAVLSACADLGALDLGTRMHQYSDNSAFMRNVQICNTLIDMYIKCGSLEAAFDVFEGMKEPTVVSWSAMIHGLAIHGKADHALELFFEMIRSGVKPNEVTFIGVLSACSHNGLVNEGRAFFASMNRHYEIVPCIEHYGCMVDLLSRAGLLQEAREFIKQMPIKPNAAVWGALLGGCKLHKNIEMAQVAMAHLEELDPLNDGYYVVLANIYSEAKQWDEAAKVRKLMRNKGLKKTLGSSLVTFQGTMYDFLAGDESHPQTEQIYEMWNQLQMQMRLRGYVPNTSVVLLDMEEKEKEKFLSRHSEKLALVCGLINTQPGETIRILKNLRICEDCHASFKLISEITDRQIVVRDRNRFHCFKDGSCSCRDYW